MPLGLDIVDCHIHPFISAAANTSWFPGVDTPADFVAEMRRAGITQCCGSVVYLRNVETFDEVRAMNDEALEMQRRFPDFFLPGIQVHAGFPDESCQEVERLAGEHGARWIGELVGYIHGFESYADAGSQQIYALAQDMGLPVNVHPYKLDELDLVCRNFPKLNLVLAHPTAGKATILERFEFLEQHANAHLDLSGSGVFRWGALRHGIDKVGPERFLFGSDFPICSPGMLLQGVMFEHLDETELELVLAGNFRRLTGMA